MLDREQQTTLNDIRWHWDDAYLITCENGTWTAISMDFRQVELTADSSAELREILRLDYAQYQPCRQVSEPDGRGT